MARQRTVAVDFDGTISQYYKWTGPFNFGPPLPGIRDFLQGLRDRDYKILVYSCRAKNDKIAGAMRAYMKKHDLEFDEVFVSGFKPEASAYVDDRAITVQPQKNGKGDFDKALDEIDELIEWKKKEKLL